MPSLPGSVPESSRLVGEVGGGMRFPGKLLSRGKEKRGGREGKKKGKRKTATTHK